MQQSAEINELAKALSKAQQEDLFALTDSENPFFKSKYADLSSVWKVLRKPLTKNGLSISQLYDFDEDGKPIVITQLMHESGQWIRGRLKLNPVKEDPQALGSAITYGRRYSLSGIMGIAQEDDDAESAMKRNGKQAPRIKLSKDAVPLSAEPKKKADPPSQPPRPSKAQFAKIFAIGKGEGLSEKEIKELADWYKSGEHMTADEAGYLIDHFQETIDNYMNSPEYQEKEGTSK